MSLPPDTRASPGQHEQKETKAEVGDDELDEEPLDLSTYPARSTFDSRKSQQLAFGVSLLPNNRQDLVREPFTIGNIFRQIPSPVGPAFQDYLSSISALSPLNPIKFHSTFPEIRPSPKESLPEPITGISGTGLRPILRARGKERSLLTCSVCLKAFDRPSLLKRHMRTHTGEKPHVCDVCSKGFSTSSSLNTHRRIHSGEKPHQCPICGKRFTASSNLYYHRMTHNKEKPHKCLTCGKSFPTPGDLRSHQYVHSGTWPFTCPVCQRGFSKQTNLRNHILLHSGDKPHSCTKCEKKFALACNLRAHCKTHEEDQPRRVGEQRGLLVSGVKCSKCSRPCLTVVSNPTNALCQLCKVLHPEQSGVKVQLASTKKRVLAAAEGGIANTQVRRSWNQEKILPESVSNPVPADTHHQISIEGEQQPPDPGLLEGTVIGSEVFHSSNPFLEQLITWNSQFVRETGLAHQKLLESQFMASKFLISSSTRSPLLQSASSHSQQISANFPPVDELIFPFTFPLPLLPPLIPTTDAHVRDWSLEFTNKAFTQ